MDGASSAELCLVKSLSSPAELAHLKTLDINHKPFEGVYPISYGNIYILYMFPSNIFLTF